MQYSVLMLDAEIDFSRTELKMKRIFHVIFDIIKTF